MTTVAGQITHRGPRTRPWAAAELVALLASPVVVFLLLGEQGMTDTNIIDQRFYQAYAEHGDDLMLRLGDYRYYWVRLAFILPARLCYRLFGAVDGFFVWRYVLALVAVLPAYLLLRRLHGRAAGWLAVPVVLANPVLVYAWGTDYPDSSAVSYLLCSTACLFMPSTPRRRWGWLVLAGLTGALAIHSQFVAGPLVAVAWLVYLGQQLRTDWRRALAGGVVLLACAAVVTALLSLVSLIMWDRADILWPTIRAAEHFRTPNELRKWHSPNWRWVLRNTYLLIPLLAPALWWATRRFARDRGPGDPRASVANSAAGVALVCLLQMLVFTYLQFFAVTSELEYHVYSSMLWPSATLVFGLALANVCEALPDRRSTWAAAAVAALAIPYLLTFVRDSTHFRLLAGIAASVVLLVLVRGSDALRRFPAVMAGVAALIIATTYVITTAEPLGQTWLANQRPFAQPDFSHVLRNQGAWHGPEAHYELAAAFNRTMPQATQQGQTLLTWFAPGDDLSSDISAQYLWTPQSLSPDLPLLSALDVRILLSRHAATLVLLGPDSEALAEAVTALTSGGFQPQISLRETLRSPPLSDQVWVITLHGRV